MNKRTQKNEIPVLAASPFAPMDVVDDQNLSTEDRSFLVQREQIIEAGRKTFLQVGKALLEIREYRNGLLYKRFGTFDAYCKERWDLGHSHAYRLMDAAEVYRSLSPRGDKAQEVELPVTEKQLRPLKRLPSKLRLRAWKNAIKAAGAAPVVARHVEREVRILIDEEGIQPPVEPETPTQKFRRLPESDVTQILSLLTMIRKSVARGAVKRIPDLLDEITRLLPSS